MELAFAQPDTPPDVPTITESMADAALITAVVLSCAAAYIGRYLARERERNRGVRVLIGSIKSALWSTAMHLPQIYPIAVIAVAVAVASLVREER
jgi:uncharacterized membrane protein YjjP (DUF1212 family)